MDHAATQRYLAGRAKAAIKINMIMQSLPPDVHETLVLFKQFHLTRYPSAQSLLSGCHLGLTVIFNKEIMQHVKVSLPLTIPEYLLMSSNYTDGKQRKSFY